MLTENRQKLPPMGLLPQSPKINSIPNPQIWKKNTHQKNTWKGRFVEVPINLTKYRSENNFVELLNLE